MNPKTASLIRRSRLISLGALLAMRATQRCLMTWWLLSTALLLPLSSTADAPSIEAVWKTQRATFGYAGETTFYTCAELERKLMVVLRVIGAHEHMVIDGRDCDIGGRTRLQITFKSPIEATPENVRALTTYGTEQELVARLNGVALPSAENLERFPASWRVISFTTDRRLKLSAADCEFIEQVRKQLLPRISGRVLKGGGICSPGSHAVRAPTLKFSALVADTR